MISVAMATYNGEKYIREQLDSILSQTVSDIELIVCDDCSSDSTRDILREYEAKDSRVKVFFNEKNLGFVRNFEKASSLCSGEYIAFSDQDDIWCPEHLEVLYNNIGDYDMIGADASFIDSEGKPLHGSMMSLKSKELFSADSKSLFNFLLYRNVFQGTASMVRRRLVEMTFPIPERMKFHDWYLALIATSQGGGIVIPQKVLYYRQHEETQTESRGKTLFGRIKESIFKLFTDKNEDISDWRERKILLMQNLLSRGIGEPYKSMVTDALWWYKAPRSPKKVFFLFKNYDKMFYAKKNILRFWRAVVAMMLRNAI